LSSTELKKWECAYLGITVIRASRQELFLVIAGVKMDGEDQLPLIVQAGGPFRPFFGIAQRGQ
jgi:hypothetical protein